MRRGLVIVVLGLAVTAAACGCKSKGTSGTGTGGTTDAGTGPKVDPKVCDEARAHVKSLYEAEMPDLTGAEEDKIALENQIVDDNVEMMLTDCRAQPGRFAPCLQSAVSVAQMERDCLEPLDEQGSEGQRFLSK